MRRVKRPLTFLAAFMPPFLVLVLLAAAFPLGRFDAGDLGKATLGVLGGVLTVALFVVAARALGWLMARSGSLYRFSA